MSFKLRTKMRNTNGNKGIVLGFFVPRESYNSKTGPTGSVPAKSTETPVGWSSASDDQVRNLKKDKKCGI